MNSWGVLTPFECIWCKGLMQTTHSSSRNPLKRAALFSFGATMLRQRQSACLCHWAALIILDPYATYPHRKIKHGSLPFAWPSLFVKSRPKGSVISLSFSLATPVAIRGHCAHGSQRYLRPGRNIRTAHAMAFISGPYAKSPLCYLIRR